MNHNKGSDEMSYNPILKQLESGSIDAEKAYEKLFVPTIKQGGKRAFFVKMRIQVPEEGKGVNTFLKILFMIPIPLIFAQFALRIFGNKINEGLSDVDFDVKDILELIKYSRHTKIQVESDDARIDIKII